MQKRTRRQYYNATKLCSQNSQASYNAIIAFDINKRWHELKFVLISLTLSTYIIYKDNY